MIIHLVFWLSFFFSGCLYSQTDECLAEWLQKASERADPAAISWVKQQLQGDQQLEILRNAAKESLQLNTKKCLTTVDPLVPEAEISLYVMISFSVPEESWVSLSRSMETCGAVFVLRGLPNNSFKELSKKIQHLNSLGVNAPIQINPNLFTDYQIDRVPTFLSVEHAGYRKISGNISLAWAIEKMGGIK